MGIIDEIKKEAKRGGKAFRNIFYVVDGQSRKVRFLDDFEDAVEIPWLNCYAKNINMPNPQYFGNDNPYADDDDVKEGKMFLWQVYDIDDNQVRLMIYKYNNCSPLPSLYSAYETYGTITDRAYVIKCTGAASDRKMTAMPLDKSAIPPKLKKTIKKFNKKQIDNILKEAYTVDLQGEEEDDDMLDMTPKQLYDLCIKEYKMSKEEVKPKQNKAYYVELIEEAKVDKDFMNEPVDEDDGWGDDEEEEEIDFMKMSCKELHKYCRDNDIDAPRRTKNKAYYLDAIQQAQEQEEKFEEPDDEWEDDEDDDDLPWN